MLKSFLISEKRKAQLVRSGRCSAHRPRGWQPRGFRIPAEKDALSWWAVLQAVNPGSSSFILLHVKESESSENERNRYTARSVGRERQTDRHRERSIWRRTERRKDGRTSLPEAWLTAYTQVSWNTLFSYSNFHISAWVGSSRFWYLKTKFNQQINKSSKKIEALGPHRIPHMNAHNSAIHSGQNVETPQVSTNWRRDTQNVTKGVSFSNEKEQPTDTLNQHE